MPVLTDWTIHSACEQDIEPVLSLWDAAGGPPSVTDTRKGERRLRLRWGMRFKALVART
jgi:hypothetical protein